MFKEDVIPTHQTPARDARHYHERPQASVLFATLHVSRLSSHGSQERREKKAW